KEARTRHRSVEVVREGGNRLSVYGSTCADIGEAAFRHGVLVHQLADEIGDMGPGAGTAPRHDGLAADSPLTCGDASADSGTTTVPSESDASEQCGTPSADPLATPLLREASASEKTGIPSSPLADIAPPDEADVPHGSSSPAREPTGTNPPQGADDVPQSQSQSQPRSQSLTDPPSPHAARDAAHRAQDATHPAMPGATSPFAQGPRPSTVATLDASSELPPPISVRPAPSPLRPLRYELRRAAGVGTGFLTAAAVLVVSALTALLLARIGHTPQHRLFAAWPQELPLPPAALGAGLLGAFAFGDEFRHPALAADRGTVPRRLGLLMAKLVVSAATALLLAFLTVGCDAEALYLVYGRELARVPADWLSLSASWMGLVVGCAWAGVLAAGIFRSTTAGLAAVVAVPVVVVPLVQKALEGPAVRTAAGFPLRLRETFLLQWPFGGERYLSAVARVIAQPVGGALALSLMALLCAYLLTGLRSRVQ
ncbi:MAG: ABC transporter ATP-binding protein, partial [Streptomyces sp.]|nr:ABC transporter ATP-binding protein [Streptomyces sp.]